jgi:S-adenosyl-L-methionine hydrolase (adenosine-forming)
MKNTPLIALLTDFGNSDPFAGILKGILSRFAPGIPIVDLTHEIPPGDVRRGAITLWQAQPYFPPGTIFLAVVDPGVGTSRRGLILQTLDHTYVGPDNGLFTFLLNERFQAWELRNPKFALQNPGATFHGRDIFAPAAAHVAQGVHGSAFGPILTNPISLPHPHLSSPTSGVLMGEVLHADRFGNLLTSLGQFRRLEEDTLLLVPWLPNVSEGYFYLDRVRLYLPNGTILEWAITFADVPANSCAAIVGSSGLVEIVANRQSAAEILSLENGELVTIK